MLEIEVRSGRIPYLVYMTVQYICLFVGWSKSSFYFFVFLFFVIPFNPPNCDICLYIAPEIG
jgi:hypothetical protein